VEAPSAGTVEGPDLDRETVTSARDKMTNRVEEALEVHGWSGCLSLLKRELHRVFKVTAQTLISPALTTFLWFLVFGYSLGERLDTIRGIPYVDFLVPGLVMMALITNAFLNSGFGFFITKIHGSVTDLLLSPLSPLQIATAYTATAMIRALTVGLLIWAVAALMGASTLFDPVSTVLFMLLTAMGFASLGLSTGILAREFEHINFIPNFLLIPFTFLGGVFYSIRLLPEPWDQVSLLNPIVYMINGLRYGMTGLLDVPLFVGYAIATLTAGGGFATAVYLLHSGKRLRGN